MKQRTVLLGLSIASFLIFMSAGIMYASAQQPDQSTNATNLEQQLNQLEQQINQIEVDIYKTLMTTFGLIATVLIGIQGGIFFIQYHRESKRESREAKNEEKRLDAELKGVNDVSGVMNLVKQTLDNRLTAEKEAREKERKAQDELEKMKIDIAPFSIFIQNHQKLVADSRNYIEEKAEKLGKVFRQDFKFRIKDLRKFSEQFDYFQDNYLRFDERQGKFNSTVYYVRGIAAHYDNQPETEKCNLLKVISDLQEKKDESDVERNRRISYANYYLGLVESNFGHYDDAIQYFKRVEEKTPDDFLNMVVHAEAYLMKGDFPSAIEKLGIVKRGLETSYNPDQKLVSRCILMDASIKIMKREEEWSKEAKGALEQIVNDTSPYYFATATLGQICFFIGEKILAEKLFNSAYKKCAADIDATTEVRVKIHLLMVTGMCARHDPSNSSMSGHYLDKARELLKDLPTIDSDVCTVFSNLSKRNENSAEIQRHIDLIEKGEVLLK